MYRLLYLVILNTFISSSYSNSNVPVLIFNTHQHVDEIPEIPALMEVPYNQFKSDYVKLFTSKNKHNNILFFQIETLSIEDLASHESEFKYISSVMEGGHYLFLPNVENPVFLPSDLHTDHDKYNLITLERGSSIAGITLKENMNNIVLVKLPSSKTDPSRSHAIQKTAEIMESVLTKIGEKKPFTVIITAKEPSVNIESSDHRRYRRLTISNEEPVYTTAIHNVRCGLLYIRDQFIYHYTDASAPNGTKALNLTMLKSDDIGDCHDSTAMIQLKYTNIEGFSKLFVQFHFRLRNNRQWHLINAAIKSQESKITYYFHPKRELMWVPIGKSYSCAQTLNLYSNDSVECGNCFLEIGGLQVETFPLGINATAFNDSFDCIGFFTIPIWMGLIASFICAVILAWGMYMLADVKTMDRFDDPKGKHIMVVASE